MIFSEALLERSKAFSAVEAKGGCAVSSQARDPWIFKLKPEMRHSEGEGAAN